MVNLVDKAVFEDTSDQPYKSDACKVGGPVSGPFKRQLDLQLKD